MRVKRPELPEAILCCFPLYHILLLFVNRFPLSFLPFSRPFLPTTPHPASAAAHSHRVRAPRDIAAAAVPGHTDIPHCLGEIDFFSGLTRNDGIAIPIESPSLNERQIFLQCDFHSINDFRMRISDIAQMPWLIIYTGTLFRPQRITDDESEAMRVFRHPFPCFRHDKAALCVALHLDVRRKAGMMLALSRQTD